MKVVIFGKILQKSVEYVAWEAVGYVNKVKDSFQRTSEIKISITLLQSSARPTELSKEGVWNKL